MSSLAACDHATPAGRSDSELSALGVRLLCAAGACVEELRIACKTALMESWPAGADPASLRGGEGGAKTCAPPALACSSEYSELEVLAKAAAVDCCPSALDRSSSSSLYAASSAAAVDIVSRLTQKPAAQTTRSSSAP